MEIYFLIGFVWGTIFLLISSPRKRIELKGMSDINFLFIQLLMHITFTLVWPLFIILGICKAFKS